jgi:phosphoribosylaminoimidazole (AIR) synthetase
MMNNDTKFIDEMRYAMFLNDLVSDGVAMCSALLDYSALKVLNARGEKFIVDTAMRRRVAQ